MLILLLLACSGSPGQEEPAALPAPEGPPPAARGERPDAPPRFDRLLIPADSPAWEHIREGFSGNYGFYGERRWDDVSARVFSHQAHAARDLARARAASGDLAGAAAAYRALAERLEGIALGEEGIGPPLRALLSEAARRDAALCASLAAGEAPPLPEYGEIARLRARYLGAVLRGDTAELAAVAADAAALLEDPPWRELDPAKFEDFDDRHQLRLALYRRALDATDPLALDYGWGYWQPDEATRQVEALRRAALDPGETPLARPAAIAAALRAEQVPPAFSAVGLGWLPTGDSYVDVGAEPGPLAIGRLERLGLDDPEHRAWLEERAAALNEALSQDPEAVPGLIAEVVATLDAYGHGSRFYNIKQAKNEGIRQLARAGRYDLALAVARTLYPLHAQDWACPNREGIVQGLEGRLMLLAGDQAARGKLEEALATGDRWLRDIAETKRAPGPGR